LSKNKQMAALWSLHATLGADVQYIAYEDFSAHVLSYMKILLAQ